VSPINTLFIHPSSSILNFVFENSEESVTSPSSILEKVYKAKSVYVYIPASLSFSLVQLNLTFLKS
jgi:hypothetical protein